LDFEEEPDYEYLESLLLVIKERYNLGENYEWDESNK
jgi:hypothetical protein